MIHLMNGDSFDLLKSIESSSVDSLITDPPAGIGFMGKNWDHNRGGSKNWITWMTSVMSECLRVLKPGAHGLVWALPRTSHWTATALEDAGFEIRDVVTHIFGSGFPKSLDISKAIDKWAGGMSNQRGGNINSEATALRGASTKEAKQWEGWGTALKPASEHWILVRKPTSEKTVTANVLKHGVGGINIDASRIGFSSEADKLQTMVPVGKIDSGNINMARSGKRNEIFQPSSQGRFPANLILSHNPDCVDVGVKKVKGSHGGGHSGKGDSMFAGGRIDETNQHVSEDGTETISAFECTENCPVQELDRQSGVLKSGGFNEGQIVQARETHAKGAEKERIKSARQPSTGGASRFFYCAKPSKREKNEGCINIHPTVKSLKLMGYLIKLVTPSKGTVLDPFMGSGSTGVSSIHNGFNFIGIEKENEYFEIAESRINNILI